MCRGFVQDVVDVDEWAARKGGRRTAFGPQAALAHYIGLLPTDGVVIVHKDFTPEGHFYLWALKALSKLLCLSTISQTAHVIILVKKTLATAIFGSGFREKVIAKIGIHQSLGLNEAHDIAKSILQGTLPQAQERRRNMTCKITDATI